MIGGGEYEKLNSFFQRIGISHRVSCPHAHQQNGAAERKHRHIVEVGLALLANAAMPLKYWDQAFLTATYLINILPSKVIGYETPVARLLHEKPDYNSLRIFGCACWPNLRPYNSRKLSFRSTRCAFLGYSAQHKGFKCLDISTGRIYISRDVIFDETYFPFAHLHSNAGAQLRKEIVLLPDHLKNLGDVSCANPNITNASSGSSAISQKSAENLASDGAFSFPNSLPQYPQTPKITTPSSRSFLTKTAPSDWVLISRPIHWPDGSAPCGWEPTLACRVGGQWQQHQQRQHLRPRQRPPRQPLQARCSVSRLATMFSKLFLKLPILVLFLNQVLFLHDAQDFRVGL